MCYSAIAIIKRFLSIHSFLFHDIREVNNLIFHCNLLIPPTSREMRRHANVIISIICHEHCFVHFSVILNFGVSFRFVCITDIEIIL